MAIVVQSKLRVPRKCPFWGPLSSKKCVYKMSVYMSVCSVDYEKTTRSISTGFAKNISTGSGAMHNK